MILTGFHVDFCRLSLVKTYFVISVKCSLLDGFSCVGDCFHEATATNSSFKMLLSLFHFSLKRRYICCHVLKKLNNLWKKYSEREEHHPVAAWSRVLDSFLEKFLYQRKKKKRNKSHLLMKFRLRKFSWNDPWYSKQTSCFYLVTQLNFHPRLKSICALRNKDLLKISGQRCPWHAYVPRPARSGRS